VPAEAFRLCLRNLGPNFAAATNKALYLLCQRRNLCLLLLDRRVVGGTQLLVKNGGRNVAELIEVGNLKVDRRRRRYMLWEKHRPWAAR